MAPCLARVVQGARRLQAHNRYLVTEADEGLMVIDQHALHERILYEELRDQGLVLSRSKSSGCWCPSRSTCRLAEAAAVLEQKSCWPSWESTSRISVGDDVVVSAYPAMLANILRPSSCGRLPISVGPGAALDRRDLLDRLLHTIACRAAIKAGDRLTQAEIEALLERRHLAQDAHHCPHGRPTTLIFTREELDRRFKRT
jgi:DNA mismatch repair protein MutL